MASFTNYKIDFTPQHTNDYWRIELVAYLIKKGDPEVNGGFDLLSIPSCDVVTAEFSLALTCPQLAEIRRGRNINQTWDRLDNIFEHCGPVREAPLFRQVAHQYLDERPEMKELLRKFLDEIEGEEDTTPLHPSPLTVLRKLVTDPELFPSRKRATSTLDPLGMLNGVKRICGCNPYVPIDEIPERKRSLLNCTYCKYAVLFPRAIKVGNTTVYKPIRLYNGAGNLKEPWQRPHLKTRLVSIVKITPTGHRMIFKRNEAMIVSSTGEVELLATRPGARPPKVELDEVRTQPSDYSSLAAWHRRLGHIDLRDLLSGYDQYAYRDLKLPKQSKYNSPSCKICKAVKLPGLPLRQVPRVRTRVLQLIHADFCGPIPGQSEDTVLFFISFTDDASGWMTIYLVKNSTSILKYFKKYVNRVESRFRQQIEDLQSNDDLGKAFDDYLRVKGICRRKRPTDTYHIHALLETTRCMLMQSGLDDTFYSEALFTACYIRNRSCSARLNGLSPFHKWFDRPPSLRHIHEFGARVTCRPINGKKKGQLETKEGRYLGFAEKTKAYKIWIPDCEQIVLSKDVDFNENINPQEENDTGAERRRSDAGGTVERPSMSNSDAGTSGEQIVLSKDVDFNENINPQEENDTGAERRRSDAGGTVERPSMSNSDAGTSGGQMRAVTPERKKILDKCSSYDSEHPDYSGAPQWNDRDCNDYMSSEGYHIPGSSKEDGDSDGHEEEIINEENASDAPGKGKDDNEVGEPTVTNKPVKDSPEEQTPAQPSAQSSAQPSAQPSAEEAGPGGDPQ